MSLPALGEMPGVVFRPLDVVADIGSAFEVISTCELLGVGWTDATVDSVRSLVAGPDSLREAQLIAIDDGHPVGLLTAEIDRHGREVFVDAFAIGERAVMMQRELLARGLHAAAAVAAADPSAGRWRVVSSAYEQDVAYRAVLEELGLQPVRRYWRMIRDLTGVSAVEPSPPAGVTCRPVGDEDDRRLLHALFRASFAGHFGSSHSRPYEEWIATIESHPGSDPERWWLLYLDDDPIGLCILDDSKAESGEGYVQTIGVVPSARGRGVATWALACAASDAVARARTGLALSVDGENTTGAVELYLKSGFTTRQVIDAWGYPLPASAASR